MIDESQVVEGATVYVRTIGERVRVTGRRGRWVDCIGIKYGELMTFPIEDIVGRGPGGRQPSAIVVDGVRYESVSVAAEATGISERVLYKGLKAPHVTASGHKIERASA